LKQTKNVEQTPSTCTQSKFDEAYQLKDILLDPNVASILPNEAENTKPNVVETGV